MYDILKNNPKKKNVALHATSLICDDCTKTSIAAAKENKKVIAFDSWKKTNIILS